MSDSNNFHPLKNFKNDIPASIVVFLVAVPLCLGIALASGAPLFSGLIAGIVGGIVTGALSKSSLGVSGPAAGLAVIVLTAIQDLGAFELFLVAVVLAGIIQIILGFAKGGIIAYYFPSSVIMGMLAGIGVIIFLKQVPHAFGYDADPMGDFEYQQLDHQNTFSELLHMTNFISLGAVVITVVSLAILLLWESKFAKKITALQIIPGPLVAVITGILLQRSFVGSESFEIKGEHLVQIPVSDSIAGFFNNFTFPDWAGLASSDVYFTAFLIAIVASLETLLSVEATDKLDPYKRITPTNRELMAQGAGNIVSGLIGGLPITQVIVRSSANVQSNGKTKASTVIHGSLILLSIMFIPMLLNQIPLATLASILLIVGYKLAKPATFVKMYQQGMGQLIPFVVTILAIVFTDLLIGLGIGLLVAILIILYNNFKIPYKIENLEEGDSKKINIELAQEVTFLNKASILKTLQEIPNDSELTVNTSNTLYMHYDVQEILENFKINAKSRGIKFNLIEAKEPPAATVANTMNVSIENQ